MGKDWTLMGHERVLLHVKDMINKIINNVINHLKNILPTTETSYVQTI